VGKGLRARPVKPLGRGRPWLRRTRAHVNSILGRSGFDGHGTFEAGVTGAIDLAHASSAEGTLIS
jgi:hypothetical protein